MIITVRANASQATINNAITQLKDSWDTANTNAEVIDYIDGQPIKVTPSTAYLQIGSVIRWGYNNGFDGWGFSKNDVDRLIAGQKEYAYSR